MPRHTIRRCTAIAMTLLILAGCSDSSDPGESTTSIAPTTSSAPQTTAEALVGRWERTGGNFSVLQGMIVEVDADVTEGVVTYAPRNSYGFKEGDVKWSAFTGVSLDRVRFRDLVRDSDTSLPSYITGVITLTEDGDMIEMNFPSSGTVQVWTRVP